MDDPSQHERLVFLHGFTQTHHHWHQVAHLLSERLPGNGGIGFVDLPGHGLSAADRTGIASSAGSLVAAAGSGTYIGYSMGGRFGLVAAAAGMAAVRRLVLIGATPGIEDETAREERMRADGERADHLETIGVDAFLDEWLDAPMFAGLPDDPAGLAHRRRNTVGGLAHSLRRCGNANQGSLWKAMADIAIPVLVMAGERDEKFTAIGHRMCDRLPAARFVGVPGAGHAAHAEQPSAVADIIADWIVT